MWMPNWIAKLVKHTDDETSRYALGGVNCEVGNGTVRLCATDGKQLITVTKEDESEQWEGSVIIDGKSLVTAARAVKCGKDGGLHIDPTDPHLTLRGKNKFGRSLPDWMPTRTVEGRFPRVSDVFSGLKPDGTKVVVDARLLRTFCDTVIDATGGSGSLSPICLAVTDSDDAVQLSAKAADGAVIRGILMPLSHDDSPAYEVEMTHADLSVVPDPATDDAEPVKKPVKKQRKTKAVSEERGLDTEVAAVEAKFVNGVMPA